MPPQMVLFDCDGVLVDSEPLTAEVLCQNLRRHGLEVSRAQFDEFFLGGTISGLAQTARGMGASLPESWVDEIYEEMFEVLAASVEVIDGIWSVLDALDTQGILYAVGSNGPHRKMQITLGRTGLIERLEGRVYSREDVRNPKPAPDIYLKAAKDAGVAPERCVVIEDSPSGARAGKAAGMVTFGYAAQTAAPRLEPICDHLFYRMSDLPSLLGS